MIRECEEHGYFRDGCCPVCGYEGRFVMKDVEVEKVGRTLAAVLRHGKFGLDMDEHGYVDIKEVCDAIRVSNKNFSRWLRPWQLEALVLTDPKGRYSILGNKVRANYGHTIEVDLQLPTDSVPDLLYFPVDPEDLDSVLGDGISPGDRAMVHLSKTYADAVLAGAARCDDPAILEVDVAVCSETGHPVGKAARTVYLCDSVPPEAIREAERPDGGEGDGERCPTP